MIDHVEIARQFVHEQINKRNDVIGALLYGTTARRETTETSDIDISIYIKEDKGEGGLDLSCWRNGVFLDATVVTTEGLDSLDGVMESPIYSTHMNDALILYDPTGFFARLQKQVRPLFMQKKWLRKRLEWESNYFEHSLLKLRESIMAMDQLMICKNAMAIPHVASAVPLFIAGINPSSTRKLFLLAKVRPRMREEIINYECSVSLDASSFIRLHGLCKRYHLISSKENRSGLPNYIAWKALRTMEKGAIEEAIDMLWFAMGTTEPKADKLDEAQVLIKEWLCGLGWEGETTLAEKLRLAEMLKNEIYEMLERCI